MAAERGQAEHPSGSGPAGEGGGGAGPDGRRRPRRRSLLIGGGTAVGLGAVGLAARDELSRWWWRIPGNEKPRTPGAVDHRGAEWIAASDANLRRADRPADHVIDRVVIHVVQGSYAVALKVFQDPAHGAAAHYVVRAKDGHVAQMIRELDIGHHAGDLSYNQRSVGIEHEGFVDRPEDFTDAMYASSAKLTAGICGRYGIPIDREHIVGHHEVPGADHTDPGPHWDWERYLRLVRAATS
ncbi:N-acetylmuramoyl-L-alanine amidase [Streptomyces oceani]|uniref:N-acetylmuramoyl-L-alanine amidase n=1 Tax=Streptomyces oceani TaxID=1075402 RepID=A0A1E7KNJ4_9ACTN|nr:N-acetylmuramoyl-L-alanine amidase [Streptomyces oceani]OEV05549.1 N-acetylmuramoyl-L-alanine amidase [Streptomyces oceani]